MGRHRRTIPFIAGLVLALAWPAESLEWSAELEASPSQLYSDGFDLRPPIHVRVTNTGTTSWKSKPERLYLSYHLLDEAGDLVRYDNPRFAVPNLAPRQTATVAVGLPDS